MAGAVPDCVLEHEREAATLVVEHERADVHSDRVLQLAGTRLVDVVPQPSFPS